MSRSRPFKHHKPETLRYLTRPDSNIGEVKQKQIREELALRQQLASLEPEQRLEKPRAPQGTRPEDRMNKTETRFALYLDELVGSGSYRDYWFEYMKVRVGVERDWYTMDFVAQRPDGLLDVYEVKGGHVHEDAIEKFKAAALLYPWARWRMMQWKDGSWTVLYDYDRNITTNGGDDAK